MKKLSFVAVLTVIILFVSCGTINNGATTSTTNTSGISTTSQAYTSGRGFGTSLTALYNSYKTAGKLNLNDATNLLNLASLATYASAIKGNAKNTTFYKEFAAGAVASSNLITTNNIASIISSVINTDINSIVNAARSSNNTNTNTKTNTNTNINTAAVVNTLTSVLNAMNNAK